MHFGLLTFRSPQALARPETKETQRIQEEALARGHHFEIFHEALISCLSEENDKRKILSNGKPFPALDALLARPSFLEEPSLHTVTLELLESSGLRVMNTATSILHTKNKLLQRLTLSQASLPQPVWAISRHPEEARRLAEVLGFPLVIKVGYGSFGTGVFFAPSRESFFPLVDYLHIRDGNPLLLERYLPEAKESIRVFVVGRNVIASARVVAQEKDMRSNARGGQMNRLEHPLSESLTDLAVKATEALGLDVAGVDLVDGEKPCILEVNANPGFVHLEQVTGINIAEAILTSMETYASS